MLGSDDASVGASFQRSGHKKYNKIKIKRDIGRARKERNGEGRVAWHGLHAASGNVCSRTTRTRVSSAEKKRAEIDVNTVIPHRLSRTAFYIYKATPILPFTTPSLLPSIQTTQLRRPSPLALPLVRLLFRCLTSKYERTYPHPDPHRSPRKKDTSDAALSRPWSLTSPSTDDALPSGLADVAYRQRFASCHS